MADGHGGKDGVLISSCGWLLRPPCRCPRRLRLSTIREESSSNTNKSKASASASRSRGHPSSSRDSTARKDHSYRAYAHGQSQGSLGSFSNPWHRTPSSNTIVDVDEMGGPSLPGYIMEEGSGSSGSDQKSASGQGVALVEVVQEGMNPIAQGQEGAGGGTPLPEEKGAGPEA
jgi:hypothetical protein